MNLTYGVGADPFDLHANILSGTALLKAMYERFGYATVGVFLGEPYAAQE